jgi:nucleotide-binding universal stress UspA family protein
LFAEFRQAHAGVEESLLTTARQAVQQHLDAVLPGHDLGIEVTLEYGTPHVGLLRVAEEAGAGTIVVGPGTTALDIVRHAPGAVLVARRSPAGPVVGATDFSDASFPALHAAASEARRRGTTLHLLHAFDVDVFAERRPPAAAMPYFEGKSWIAFEGLEALRGAATRRHEELLRDAGVAGQTAVLSGPARDVVVEYAETSGATLVVVGTHGRSGFARLLLGSTAAFAIERAPCSVLVVRLTTAGVRPVERSA